MFVKCNWIKHAFMQQWANLPPVPVRETTFFIFFNPCWSCCAWWARPGNQSLLRAACDACPHTHRLLPASVSCKNGVHHGGAAEQVDQRHEGLAVPLVRPGLQRRLALILHGRFVSSVRARRCPGCGSRRWLPTKGPLFVRSWSLFWHTSLHTDSSVGQSRRSSQTHWPIKWQYYFDTSAPVASLLARLQSET